MVSILKAKWVFYLKQSKISPGCGDLEVLARIYTTNFSSPVLTISQTLDNPTTGWVSIDISGINPFLIWHEDNNITIYTTVRCLHCLNDSLLSFKIGGARRTNGNLDIFEPILAVHYQQTELNMLLSELSSSDSKRERRSPLPFMGGHCRRVSAWVRTELIQGSDQILLPTTINVGKCIGSCSIETFVNKERIYGTAHSSLLAVLHKKDRRFTKPSCVPVSYKVTVAITYNAIKKRQQTKLWTDLYVDKCGCR